MSEVLCKLSWMRGHGVFWNWDGQGRAGARADGRGGCQETVKSGYPAGKGGRMNRGSPSEPAVRQRPPTNLLVRLPRLRPPSSALDSRRIRFDDEFSSAAITTRRSNRLHYHLKRCCAAEQILSELLIPIIRIYNPFPVLSTWSGHVRLPVQLRHRPAARRSSRSIRVGDGDDGFFFNCGANR